MARNKIIYGNETLIDLSGDTAKESDVAQGKTFHKADGSQATGTATGGGTAITPSNSSPVPLTKDSNYTIEDNDGYAIDAYAELTSSSSVETLQYPMLYRPQNGKTVYASDCSDLGSDSFDIEYGKKYIGKNGVKRTGSRPKSFLRPRVSYEPTVYIYTKRFPTPNGILARVGDDNVSIYIVTSSDDKSVLLSLTNPETKVESTITICSPGTAYVASFQITNMHMVSMNHFIIEYSYDTSATARSQTYARSILIKNDYTLAQSAAINTSTASSSTTSVESHFMQTLYGDYFSFFCLRSVITDSTGARTLTGWKTWMSILTGTFTNASSNSINIGSDVDVYCPIFTYTPPFAPCSRGGFFYRNASGVDYICLIGHYSDSGVKNMTLESADSTGTLADIGVENHYILGLSNDGLLVTAKGSFTENQNADGGWQHKTTWRFYFWLLDLSSSSNILHLKSSYTIVLNAVYSSMYPTQPMNIIMFRNNIILFMASATSISPRKYQIINKSSNILELEPMNINYRYYGYYSYDTIGVLGDSYNMIGMN